MGCVCVWVLSVTLTLICLLLLDHQTWPSHTAVTVHEKCCAVFLDEMSSVAAQTHWHISHWSSWITFNQNLSTELLQVFLHEFVGMCIFFQTWWEGCLEHNVRVCAWSACLRSWHIKNDIEYIRHYDVLSLARTHLFHHQQEYIFLNWRTKMLLFRPGAGECYCHNLMKVWSLYTHHTSRGFLKIWAFFECLFILNLSVKMSANHWKHWPMHISTVMFHFVFHTGGAGKVNVSIIFLS